MIKHAWKASTEVGYDHFIVQLDDDHYILQLDDDQDEEKFQREILSDEPNLIKLYLQVANSDTFW